MHGRCGWRKPCAAPRAMSGPSVPQWGRTGRGVESWFRGFNELEHITGSVLRVAQRVSNATHWRSRRALASIPAHLGRAAPCISCRSAARTRGGWCYATVMRSQRRMSAGLCSGRPAATRNVSSTSACPARRAPQFGALSPSPLETLGWISDKPEVSPSGRRQGLRRHRHDGASGWRGETWFLRLLSSRPLFC